MISSESDTYQSQTTNSAQVLSDFVASTPLTSVTTHAESIAIQALPAPLAAPAGWRSEIVRSNSPGLTSSELAVVRSGASASYGTTGATHTEHFASESYGASHGHADGVARKHVTINENAFIGNDALAIRNASFQGNAAYGMHEAAHESHAFLSEHEKRNIITRVEQQQPPPLVIRKTLPNNTVTYQQNVSVRYLQPPTPPPPGPIIIREVRPPPPPPRSPIKIQQRAPAAPTPPPLVLREKPPPPPPGSETKVVEKLLPPLPEGPRRMIVERFGPCPPKPSDVIIERWLPYKDPGRRRVLVERAPPPCVPQQEQNLLILHDGPRACVQKEFINQGVVRADPDCYMQRYGSELDSWHGDSRNAHLVSEASRAVPPPFSSSGYRSLDNDYRYCSDRYERAPSPCIASLPRCSSSYEPSYSYCRDLPYDCEYTPPRRYYDDCYRRRDDCQPVVDVTSSWNRYCRSSDYDCLPSSSYDSYCSPCTPCTPRTVRVCSDDELRRVLCDLTDGRVPAGLRAC